MPTPEKAAPQRPSSHIDPAHPQVAGWGRIVVDAPRFRIVTQGTGVPERGVRLAA